MAELSCVHHSTARIAALLSPNRSGSFILYLGYKRSLTRCSLTRVRTLTGKEIELDIEPDYKVRNCSFPSNPNTCPETSVPDLEISENAMSVFGGEWSEATTCSPARVNPEVDCQDTHIGHGYHGELVANMYLKKVSRIKERVEEKEGIPPAQQRLIFGGKQMYVT